MFDLIGDIHGYARELIGLLDRVGYRKVHGVYRHRERRVIFLGDFIDRGPEIREVLSVVRPMVEDGGALAVMGNHDWNALTFDMEDPQSPGQHLRSHTPKNKAQHAQTLLQLTPSELRSCLQWFRRLPLWLDLDGLRVVHACWDGKAIARIAQTLGAQDSLSDDWLQRACNKGDQLFADLNILLQGKEISLPDGVGFPDGDGHQRCEIRTRWYLPPQGHTYRTYSVSVDPDRIPDRPLPDAIIAAAVPYPAAEKPVFVGHYGLLAPYPQRLAPNVACVDYGVANAEHGGFLCAYRWEREAVLDDRHFVISPVGPHEPDRLEQSYPGIRETIRHIEAEVLPTCARCGSVETATVHCGIIGRTINLAAATTKFKLIANGPKPGKYFCNACQAFFD